MDEKLMTLDTQIKIVKPKQSYLEVIILSCSLYG